MLITIQNRYGKNLKEITESKKELISLYSKINKEIFGSSVNETELLTEVSCGVSNMHDYFVTSLNRSLEEEGCGIKLSSLYKEVKEQVLSHFINKTKEDIVTIVDDSIEFLCSESNLTEDEVRHKLSSGVLENIEKEFNSNQIKSCKIEYLLAEEEEFNKESEKFIQSFTDSIEQQKSSTTSKSEKRQKSNKPKSNEKVSSSDNFVAPRVEQENVIDTDFSEIITPMTEQDKKELRVKIEECVNYYYNADRVTMMIGGNVNDVPMIMQNIMVIVNEMDDIVNNASDKDNKSDLLNKLSDMQLQISTMINSYNPNISKGNIINSFKAVEVDSKGDAVRVEDFFGKQYEADELVSEDSNKLEQDNYKIFTKYPDLYNIMMAIQHQTGSFIRLEEIKSSYKYMSPILKASVMMNNTDVNRYFYIDLCGTLYNNKPKFIILNKSDIIDDGYCISTSRIDLITKYIFGTITEEELKSNDLVSTDLRSLNKVIDLASIQKENKDYITKIMIQKPSKELLSKSINFDGECRFRLNEFKGNSFELISDSKTKKYFNGPSCKRKKQRMTFENGELILDGKQD